MVNNESTILQWPYHALPSPNRCEPVRTQDLPTTPYQARPEPTITNKTIPQQSKPQLAGPRFTTGLANLSLPRYTYTNHTKPTHSLPYLSEHCRSEPDNAYAYLSSPRPAIPMLNQPDYAKLRLHC
jgi:hypothetical protein